MGSRLGAAIIVVIIVSIAGVMTYYLYSSSRSFSGHLKNTTKRMSVYDEMMYNANFAIEDAEYHNEYYDTSNKTDDKMCNKTKKAGILIVKLLLNTSELPDYCEFFIDNKLKKRISISVPCWPNCKSDDLLEAVDVARINMWKKHSLKVCCDSLCAKKDIDAICP